MKRFLTLFFMVLIGLLFTIPVSAQSGGLVSVRFSPGRFTCNGTGEIIVDVAYDSNTPAWVGVYTGITSRRQVTSSRVSVALSTSSEGAVFGTGASRAMRVIVRFGPTMDSSAYDVRGYWFQCSTGNLLTSAITLRDDGFTVPETYPTNIWVLGNDTSQLSWGGVSVHRQASNGVVTQHPNGLHLIYTPNAGFIGYDTFEYKACNIGGVCRSANVTLNVYDLQQPSLSSVHLHDTTCGGVGLIDVRVYFSGATSYLTVISGTTEIIELNTSNTNFQYNQILDIPISSEGVVVGESAVQVRIMYGTSPNDGTYHDQIYWFDCNTGQQIDTAVNANNDSVNAPENFPVTINVSTNDDTNLPFDWTEFNIITDPARGTATISGDGEITYTYNLNTDFFGTDTFNYEICNVAEECDIATVTVTIIDLADPVITDMALTDTVCNASGILTIDYIYSGGSAYLTVVSGDTLALDVSSSEIADFGPTSIDVAVTSAGVVVADYAFPITVLYGTSANDDSFDSETRWYDCNTGAEITPILVANNDNATAPENFPITIDVLANDTTNLAFASGTLEITSAPTRGSASIGANNIVTYTYGSTDNFSGTDTFTYVICDVSGLCETATVTISIIDLPPPTIDNIELVEYACEGPGLVDVTVTYSGGPAVITVTTGITESMDISNSDISSFGSQTFSIPISSDNGGVQGDNVLIINVLYGTAVGDASFDSGVFYFDCETGEIIVPSVDAVDDYEPEMARGIATEVDVLTNDVSRLPLDISTFVLTSAPHVGTAEIVNGVVVYTGDGITIGITSFTYEICNTEGFCDEALVELNLVNLAPVCGGSSEIFIEVWPPNHRMVPIHIGGVYDPDGDPISYTLVSVTVYENSRSWNQDTSETDFDTENGLIRAERSGNGNGRIYAIEYIASDPDGLTCDGFAYIFVPHDQSDHGTAYPEFDADGNPFPAVPNDNGNSGNNGNRNGNNNPPVVNNPPADNPPSNTDTSGDGHNNGLGNDNNNGNAQGDPQRDNNNGNGNGNNNPPPVDNQPADNTDTSGDGHNNGLGNDNNNGNAQGDPQRDNNNGNGNGNGNGNSNQSPPADTNPVVPEVVTSAPANTNTGNGNANGNSNGNGNGNSNGNGNGNGNGN